MNPNKKLTLEEIGPDMFVKHIQDRHEDLIYFVTHKGKNDPKELYGWNIYEFEEEPAKLLIPSPRWRFFCAGDGNYYRLLTEEEKKEVKETLLAKLPDVLIRMTETIKKSE